MAALQSNIPDRQLFESSLPVAERVLALVLECLLEPLPLGPCIRIYSVCALRPEHDPSKMELGQIKDVLFSKYLVDYI